MEKRNPSQNESRRKTRREFLAQCAAGTVAGLAVVSALQTAAGQSGAAQPSGGQPAAAPASAKPAGAKGRLGVGFIGAGGRSGAHMDCVKHLKDNEKYPVELVAVCDVYRPRMEAKKTEYGIAKGYMDHRELLADPNVDVVFIATPDHHHGYQAIDAVLAGKDVYCEKPVTHWSQFELTRRLADVVAKSDRVFQLGSQAMSDSAWHQMKQLVKEGLIGRPVFGETSFFRLGDWGERGMPVDDPNAKPGPDLNWEAFLGDRPKRPFNVDRFFRWRLFEDYAGGPGTDIYPHCLTQVVDILGVGFPESVVAVGGIDRFDYELREVPDSFSLIARYPEKVTISVLGTFANDYNSVEGERGSGARMPTIRGWDGALHIDRNNREIVFTPVREQGAKAPKRIPIERGEDFGYYIQSFLDCCRTRNKATLSGMDLAFRTQTVLQMAMLALRNKKAAMFDPRERRILI